MRNPLLFPHSGDRAWFVSDGLDRWRVAGVSTVIGGCVCDFIQPTSDPGLLHQFVHDPEMY